MSSINCLESQITAYEVNQISDIFNPVIEKPVDQLLTDWDILSIARVKAGKSSTIQSVATLIGFEVLGERQETKLDNLYYKRAIHKGLEWITNNLQLFNKYFKVSEKGYVTANYDVMPKTVTKYGLEKLNYPMPYQLQYSSQVSGMYTSDYKSLFPENLKVINSCLKYLRENSRVNFSGTTKYMSTEEKEYMSDNNLENIPLHTFIDTRGRIYYRGYQINVMGDKEYRKQFTFNDGSEIHWLDANASGMQIMSILSKDEEMLRKTNLIASDDNGLTFKLTHTDTYQSVIDKFNKKNNSTFDRKFLKKLIMKFFYNESEYSRLSQFNNNEAYQKSFDSILNREYYPLIRIMQIFNARYRAKAIQSWKLPDGFIASSFEYKTEEEKFNTPFGEFRFLFQENKANENNWRSLVPNIVHSIEAYITRQIIRKWTWLNPNKQIITIHDCFGVHKEDIPFIRAWYHNIMAQLFNSNLLEFILGTYAGRNTEFKSEPISDNTIASLIRDSRTGLSAE
jgi:hypothetical protein